MSKLKNIFKLSILSVASLSILGGGVGLSLSQNVSEYTSVADTNYTINNESYDFFKAEWRDSDKNIISTLTDSNSPLALVNSGNYINLKFDVTEHPASESAFQSNYPPTYGAFYKEKDKSGDVWDCFTFTSFSITRNGSSVVLEEDSNNSATFIKKQKDDGSTKMYASPVGRGTMDFDLDIKLGTFESESNARGQLSGNELTLLDEGIYEITIPYTMYSTTDDGDSFDSSVSGNVVWTFMLFNHNTYLASGLNTPSINIQNFASTEGNTLFYNYQSDEIPYFDYDVTKYNVTITRTLNNEDTSVSLVYNYDDNKARDWDNSILIKNGNIVYNDAFQEKYENTGLFDLVYDKETTTARIFLKDIGKYTIDFDLVYSYNTDQLNPSTYILPKDVTGKTAYLYGYQSTYTKYNSSSSKNEYPEFKSYEENHKVKQSADISRYIDWNNFSLTTSTSSLTLKSEKSIAVDDIVSTNQAPVKFKEYGNYSSAKLYTFTSETFPNGSGTTNNPQTISISNGTDITSTKNVSLASGESEKIYLAIFEYTFENYIQGGLAYPSQKFHQAFLFKITNETPTVTVNTAGEDKKPELSSGDFTNQDVYIKNNYQSSEFNSDPIIEIVRYDFLNKTTDAPKNLSSYIENENNFHKITENGSYTINIYSGRKGKAGTPITRQFTIDKTDIENVDAYSVQLINSTDYVVSTTNIDCLTNQPLIFTWKDRKESGAKTYGYYQYYSLDADTTTNYESALSGFENIGCMPVNYTLNLDQNPSLIKYSNAESLINSNYINPSYVKTGAGLYVLYINDQAGNETIRFYLLDNSSMRFAIKKHNQDFKIEYSFLNSNDTLSQDATIFWGENKVFKLNLPNKFEIKIKGTDFTEEFNEVFKDKYTRTFSSSLPSGFSGNYVVIPFAKGDEIGVSNILFKDLGSNATTFKEFTGNHYDIISSYSLMTHTDEKGNVRYFFTSTTGQYYETNETDLKEYKEGKISSYELYVRAKENPLDLGGSDIEVNALVDYSGETYDAIYNREGSFEFMIRDKANTKGTLNLSKSQQYLNYPTGYQVINLSSDKSELKVVYKDSSNDIPLTIADFAALEGKIDDSGVNNAANKYKNAYYEPTSINKSLYISFIPKVIIDDKTFIQIDKIHLEFYPFVTKYSSTNDFSSTTIKAYRDLSSTSTINMDISFDATAVTAQNYELNIVNGQTQEGKYVITRTYKSGTIDENTYTIDKYDYMQRKIEFIVDRENVISEPEVISITTNKYTYTPENSKKIEITTVGSLLISNIYLGGSESQGDPEYYVESISSNKTTNDITPGKGADVYYYYFPDLIDEIKLYKNNKTSLTLNKLEPSVEQSAQSIIGNGIMVSVFSETLNSVEYPDNKNTSEGYAKYNAGYTFYTVSQSYSDILNTKLNSVFTTNKLPLKIYIPSYKYTTHTEMEEDLSNSFRSFTTYNNNSLVKFNNANFIDYYKLSAEIYLNKNKYAVSDGESDGFLTFKKLNGETLNNFTEIGEYSVVVTQAFESRANDANSFKNNYTFTFIVQQGSPEFTVYDDKGYELDGPRDENDQLTDILYTNEQTIVAKWTDSASSLITNIDVKNIKITLGGKQYLVTITDKEGSNSIDVSSSTSTKEVCQIIKDALSFSYNSTSLLNELTINLSKAGYYTHGEEILVTMEYENPSKTEGIYTPTTKTIIVDTSIFDFDGTNYTTTLNNLFDNIDNFYSEITLDNLRVYLNNAGNTTTDKIKTCYSQTVSSNFYRYYNYLVDKSFFTDLLSTVENNKTNNPKGMTSVYIRDISDNIYEKGFEETSYDSFFSSNSSFMNLNNPNTMDKLKKGYYEIIESDYAGNLNIYLVYLFDSNTNDAVIYYSAPNSEQTELSDELILTNKYNIYGSSDLTLANIQLHSDKWNFVKVEQSGRTKLYVKTPWLSQGFIQDLEKGEAVAISSLLNDSNTVNKTILSISDRADGEWKTVYISKTNISNLNLENISSGQEGIRIKLPAGDILTSTEIISYPVEITLNITIDGNTSEPNVFRNDPLENPLDSANYQTNWKSQSTDRFALEYDSTTNYLSIKFITIPPTGTKIKYTVKDNFGKETSTIHIFGTDFIDSYEYADYLYQKYDEEGNLYNYVQNSYTYQYNSNVYEVEVYDEFGNRIREENYAINHISSTLSARYTSLKFEKTSSEQLHQKYQVKVYDKEKSDSLPIKTIYVCIYDILPRINKEGQTYDHVLTLSDQNGNSISDKFSGSYGTVTINNQAYSYEEAKTFASLINISYTSCDNMEIPYNAFILKDGEKEFSPIESGYQIKESGVYYILFKYNSEILFTHEYKMYKLEVLDSSTNFFYVTLDGKVIKTQNTYFTDNNNKQYSNYYLVNVPYSESSRVKIETNVYQSVEVQSNPITIQKQGVTTVIYTLTNKKNGSYPDGVSPFFDEIAISYIPTTTSPSQKFSYVSPNGEEKSILNETSAVVTAEKETSFNQLILKWSNYFGLSENKIYLIVEKDGRNIETPVYYEDNNNICYTILDTSGLYKIYIWDYAGNKQKFGTKDYFELIFLKDAHFSMTFTNNGEEIKTEAIDKGVFNGSVKITLENVRKFYLSSSANKLTALRNGRDYTPEYNSTTTTYTFNRVGYYQIYFSATAINGVEVREQVYTFTILNPNESRYAFSYSSFSNYMITKVLKNDGIVDTVEKNDMENKDSLYVSYYDENTGLGLWTVTIDTNKKLNISANTNETTKFTFSFLIRSAVPPIEVSATEGSTSTGTIKVSFNAENIYNAVGDCILSFGSEEFRINANTIKAIGVRTVEITEAGTYYIQVTTESGNLLYSYMVIKKDPLNAWAIVAIVLGSVVAIAVVIIIIKLRKRIKVK